MDFIGKSVYMIWSANGLRFGSIAEQKTENSWTFFRINWQDDEEYQSATKWKSQLRNTTYFEPDLVWYRCDKVRIIHNPDKMANTISKL